ncbi:MAG: hypothetical protein WEB63_11475 [Cucumibacter sp.]
MKTNIAKLLVTGAFALSLVACHEPGHEGICNGDDDNDRAVCIALIVGAGAALKLIAFSALGDDEIET